MVKLNRRELLRRTGVSIGGGVVAGTGVATGSAASAPVDQWRGAHWSNYGSANRGATDINWIVIHYTVGAYDGAINWFQNPDANVSAHYVIRNSDGHTTKMVDESDVAYHAGGFNANSIGIEHEWVDGQNGFSEACYQRSAELIDYLCETYDIPKEYYTSHTAPCSTEGGIIGHMHTPTDSSCSISNSTSCPGPFDGDVLMAYLDGDDGGGEEPAFAVGDPVVTAGEVNVRESAELADNVVFTQPADVAGTVANGPHENDGYTWWWVEYENDVGGWSVQGLLEEGEDDDGDGGEQRFQDGDEVRTTTDLNGREQPGLDSDIVATLDEGTVAEVMNGPQTVDEITWWGLHVPDEGLWVWASENYLDPVEDDDDGADTRFDEGDEVKTTTDLNGRDRPGLDTDVVDVLPKGTAAEVVNGPETVDDVTWWGLHVPDEGLWVWASGNFLEPVDDRRDPLPFDVETDLTEPIDVTGAAIDAAIEAERPDSPLIGLGSTFAAVQDAYGINALYQLAHAVHESDWGTSDIAQDHNNLFGYGAEDDCPYECAERYDSFEECVWEVMDDVYELYLTPGDWRYEGPTLEGMNVYYATDPEWDVKIADHYRALAEQL